MASSATSPVSLGRHFVPIALCALLCPPCWACLWLQREQWNEDLHVYMSTCLYTLSASLRRLHWPLCFHCSFWTEHFPWVSLPPLLSSSGASGLGYSLFSMESTQLYVQARCCVTSYKCGIVPGDLSQSTAGTSAGISGFGWRNALKPQIIFLEAFSCMVVYWFIALGWGLILQCFLPEIPQFHSSLFQCYWGKVWEAAPAKDTAGLWVCATPAPCPKRSRGMLGTLPAPHKPHQASS